MKAPESARARSPSSRRARCVDLGQLPRNVPVQVPGMLFGVFAAYATVTRKCQGVNGRRIGARAVPTQPTSYTLVSGTSHRRIIVPRRSVTACAIGIRPPTPESTTRAGCVGLAPTRA